MASTACIQRNSTDNSLPAPMGTAHPCVSQYIESGPSRIAHDSTFVLFNGFEKTIDGNNYRLWIEDPFDEMAGEITRLAFGAQQHCATVPLGDPFRTDSRERQKPPGQGIVVR